MMEQETQRISVEQLQRQIREEILGNMDLTREMEDAEIWELIEEKVIRYGKQYGLHIREKEALGRQVFNTLRKLDVLQELVDDPTVSEIMINGPNQIFVERKGELFLWEKTFSSKEKLEDVIQQIVAKGNRMVNETTPIVDTRLENGSRVNVVLAPIALNGPIVTIRRFPDHPFTMDDLLAKNTLSEEVALFLKTMVEAGENIFVSGGTSSGKTTFLNVLGNYIPQKERIITIEDSAELNLKNVENLVRLETRNENAEGKNEISIRDLIRSALRMRPDRIIVGEVRAGEALDMISAMNTGHDGSLSTGHANSCTDMLKRLEMMILMAVDMPVSAIRGQIAAGIDLMVHLGRTRSGARKLMAIDEVCGYEDGEIRLNPIYRYHAAGGAYETEGWEKVGEMEHTEKLMRA